MFAKYPIVLLLLTLFSECYGTQCYQCKRPDGTCKDVSVVRCQYNCILFRFTSDGPKVLKDCAPEGMQCSTLTTILKFQYPNMVVNECNVCDKRLCNSAPKLNSVLTFALVVAAVSIFLG